MTSSTPTTIFGNPGLIDIRAVTVLGVNIKDSKSPIGFFGTGFKYALATLLRHNMTLSIYRGLERTDFFSDDEMIRGQLVRMIHMRSENEVLGRSERLGFTTELGKNC